MTRSRRGERSAFEELVRRTARLVYARIYLECRDPHRAEDLVQETYLSAWQRIAQVSEPKGFRSWLLTIAKSVVIDAARHDQRKKRSGPRADSRTEAEAMEGVATKSPTPAHKAELAEEQMRAMDALAALPEEYRQPLMLRYLAGADYATIESQLGMSNGSLRGMLNRGLNMLRERLT